MPTKDFTDFETIRVEDRGALRLITIDRAAKANALSLRAQRELYAVVAATNQDRAIRVFALTGAGERVFCAGADLTEANAETSDSEAAQAYDQAWDDLTAKIEAMPCTTVALLNGACIGAGLSLALACDFRYGVEHAFFRYPVAQHGFMCSPTDLSRLLSLSGMSLTRRLLVLGEDIPLDAAQTAGLADGGFNEAGAWDALQRIAAPIEAGALTSQLAVKRLIISAGRSAETLEDCYRAVYDDDSAAFDRLWNDGKE